MNNLNKTNKSVQKLIKRASSLEASIERIKKVLHKTFRFYDVRLANLTSALQCCKEFREWLNHLVIIEPPFEGVQALYFGLFKSEEGLHLYVIGSMLWDADDPDWACRSDWHPEGRVLTPSIFPEISKVFSEYNLAGYYMALAFTALMIREFTRESVISLLDDKRRTLHIAFGFDDGELFSMGTLHEDGLKPAAAAGKQKRTR
jgi:hypothetical protein